MLSADDERRLRPVYDAMDLREYRRALKLINSQIGKQQGQSPSSSRPSYVSQILRALKAVALDKTGKQQEALQLCEEVCAEHAQDENVLTTIAIVYRSQQRPELTIAMYEKALVDAKDDKEGAFSILESLFGAYVRSELFVKAQQACMKMYKATMSEKYMFGAITCLYMQAVTAAGKVEMSEDAGAAAQSVASRQLLQLASSMSSRYIKQQPESTSGEAIRLLIMILLELVSGTSDEGELAAIDESYQDALCTNSALRGLIDSDRTRFLAEQHMRMRRWSQAAALFRENLERNHDDWVSYVGLLDAVQQAGADMGVNADSLLREMRQKCEQSGIRLRGPALAQIEMTHRRVLSALDPKNGERSSTELGSGELGMARLIVKYVEYVGDKECCCTDLKSYLRSLCGLDGSRFGTDTTRPTTSDTLRWFAVELATVTPPLEDAVRTEAQMRRLTTMYEIDACCGFSLLAAADETMTEPRRRIARMLGDFEASLPLRRQIDSRESGPSERILIASVEFILEHKIMPAADAPSADKDGGAFSFRSRLIAAAGILETGLTSSPESAILKIQLMKVYALLGAVGGMVRVWDSLDIKHVQLDSMTYLVVPHLLPLWTSRMFAVLQNTLAYHRDHHRDAYETILMAFRFGNYTQVPDFFTFKNRLRSSRALCRARIELSIVETLLTMKDGGRGDRDGDGPSSSQEPHGLDAHCAESIANRAVDISRTYIDGNGPENRGKVFDVIDEKSIKTSMDNSDRTQCPDWFRRRCTSSFFSDRAWWSAATEDAPKEPAELSFGADDRSGLLIRYHVAQLLSSIAEAHGLPSAASLADENGCVHRCLHACDGLLQAVGAPTSTPQRDVGLLEDVASAVKGIMLVASSNGRLAQCDGVAAETGTAAHTKQELVLERNTHMSNMTSSFERMVERYIKELAACVPAASASSTARCINSALLSGVATLVNEYGLLIAFVLIMSQKLVLPERKKRRKKKTQETTQAEDGELRTAVLRCFHHACDAIVNTLGVLSLNLKALTVALTEERRAVREVVESDIGATPEEGDFPNMLAEAPLAFRDMALKVHGDVTDEQSQQLDHLLGRIITLTDTFESFQFCPPAGAA